MQLLDLEVCQSKLVRADPACEKLPSRCLDRKRAIVNTDHGSYCAQGCEEGKECHIFERTVSSVCRRLS